MSHRMRRATVFAMNWIAVGVMVPSLSFCAVAFTPSLSQALQLPKQIAKAMGSVAKPTLLAPAQTPLPDGSTSLENPNAPLLVKDYSQDTTGSSVSLTAIIGGTPGTRRSTLREGVADFVKNSGAAAGLNGTFFANASLRGTDNLLIGPSLCSGEKHVLASPFDDKPQLAGRPMVLVSAHRTVIVPYTSGTVENESTLRTYLPGMTDEFLGGVWLVHNGIAADRAGVDSYRMKDAMDYRRRAFFALMPDGRPMIGATTSVASSRQLAGALQKIGVRDAVLLDSGFSTSLVYGDRVLVTGHTAPGIASRPVPHAVVLYGRPTLETARLMSTPEPVEHHRRHYS